MMITGIGYRAEWWWWWLV